MAEYYIFQNTYLRRSGIRRGDHLERKQVPCYHCRNQERQNDLESQDLVPQDSHYRALTSRNEHESLPYHKRRSHNQTETQALKEELHPDHQCHDSVM